MAIRALKIKESPFSAVTVSGRMNENFQVNEPLILFNPETRAWCPKIVERVVDSDDGNCVLDLI